MHYILQDGKQPNSDKISFNYIFINSGKNNADYIISTIINKSYGTKVNQSISMLY